MLINIAEPIFNGYPRNYLICLTLLSYIIEGESYTVFFAFLVFFVNFHALHCATMQCMPISTLD
jgi:hypothetical protein